VRRLYFGERARRRRRAKRLALLSIVISVAAALAGIDTGPSPVGFLAPLHQPSRAGVVRRQGVEASDSAAAMIRFRRKVFEVRPRPTPTPAPARTPTPEPKATPARAAPSPTPTETPTPSPSGAATPAPAPAAGGSVTGIIYAAAAEFGVSGELLVSIASCESGLNPQAHSAAGYYGLFQFDQQTWGAYGYGSIYDSTAQARTAARLLAAGQSNRWPNCA
jgi:soluble lytic murein transglycosylase-like protein